MTSLLLLAGAGIGLACLPKLALAVFIIAVFLLIIWLIVTKVLGKYWPEVAGWAGWILLILILIIILYLLVQFYQYGLAWAC